MTSLADPDLDGSLKALALTLPDERVLGQEQSVIDVEALHAARRFAIETLAVAHRAELAEAYEEASASGPYTKDKPAIDARRLKNTALRYLAAPADPAWVRRAHRQFEEAGRIFNYDIGDYNGGKCVYHPTGMDAEALQENYWKLYERIYSWPAIARRMRGVPKGMEMRS